MCDRRVDRGSAVCIEMCTVMAYIVMAYIVMAYIVMAYIVMASIVMAGRWIGDRPFV